MRSIELLKEIDAWLSFNNHPSKDQINELRSDIKKHIEEQLVLPDVVGQSKLLVCDCGNRLTDKEIYFGQCLQCNKNIE